jgi:UDPglucose 6-dehydrogenase
MKIGFAGLWHLGSVMSAVFAGAGHDVVAYDEAPVIARFIARDLPVAEPGLQEAIDAAVAAGRLRYDADPTSLADCEIVWIAYDTPVREDGSADSAAVLDRVENLFGALAPGALVVVSSQLPVGSVAELERRAMQHGARLHFACCPENLRLGKSLAYLRAVDRFVVGTRNATADGLVRRALAPLTSRVESMTVESAEMTKHALNAFLATSVAFINELAGLCERTGADARDVERGLKSDARIGPHAYLRAGGPYAGGTLARDVAFVIDAERSHGLEPFFFAGVRAANDFQGTWLQRRFVEVVGEPQGRILASLGLVYKPGTDTLRGSSAVAFARWFAARGGRVRAFDPALRTLPDDVAGVVELAATPETALDGADAAFLATEWPEFRALSADAFARFLRAPNVFDPGRFLTETVQKDGRLRYFAIGVGRRA